jgi:hypothetical protein
VHGHGILCLVTRNKNKSIRVRSHDTNPGCQHPNVSQLVRKPKTGTNSTLSPVEARPLTTSPHPPYLPPSPLTSPPRPPVRPARSRTIRLLETVLSFFSIPSHSCSCLPSLYTPRRQTLLPMLLRSLSLFLSASASVLAQTQIAYDSAHNTTSIGGTWSSGSRNVTTGPVGVFRSRFFFPTDALFISLSSMQTYVQPNTRSFSFPTNTGVSFSLCVDTSLFVSLMSDTILRIDSIFYSDESTGWFEVLRYRMTGNGAYPCLPQSAASSFPLTTELTPPHVQAQAQNVSPSFLTGPMGNSLSNPMGL